MQMQIDRFVRSVVVLDGDDARYRSRAVCTFNVTRDETRIDSVLFANNIGSLRETVSRLILSGGVVKKYSLPRRGLSRHLIIYCHFYYNYFYYNSVLCKLKSKKYEGL